MARLNRRVVIERYANALFRNGLLVPAALREFRLRVFAQLEAGDQGHRLLHRKRSFGPRSRHSSWTCSLGAWLKQELEVSPIAERLARLESELASR